MAAPFDIITIGDLCVDLVVHLGEGPLRFGQAEQWAQGYRLELGGSACLFACQAARLGLRVGLLGRLGDDALGRLALERLQACGVDTQRVLAKPGLQTGLGLALTRPDGDRAILTVAGSLNAVYPEDIADAFLASGRHLHYASYFLQTHLQPVAGDILARARALGLTTSLDPNWDPAERWDGGLRRALAHVDLLFLNQSEALALSGAGALSAAAEALHALGPQVAIKRGAQGALVTTPQGLVAVPVEPAEVIVDTVGAGDCYDAGHLAGWLRGLEAARCAAIGNACGRASLRAAGGLAGQLTRADLTGLLD